MYVTDQPAFLNAAALIATKQLPQELLATLKATEELAGRNTEGGARWGPRPLDLDIVFHDRGPVATSTLTVPHARWRERPFVTIPVADLFRPGDGRGDMVRPFCGSDMVRSVVHGIIL